MNLPVSSNGIFYIFNGWIKTVWLSWVLPMVLFLCVKNLKAQDCPAESAMRRLGLLNIREELPEVMVDLKYSSGGNFTGRDLYGCLESAFAQPLMIKKLRLACRILSKKNPGYRFIVYDAARPLSCQRTLWNSLQMPENRKHIYVANPERGSIHNYGCAIDISIVNEKRIPIDMGTAFDFFGELAQPRCESSLLKAGKLRKEQVANRLLLRNCMRMAGFSGTSSEWWHFNACSLKQAKKSFVIIP